MLGFAGISEIEYANSGEQSISRKTYRNLWFCATHKKLTMEAISTCSMKGG